MLVQQNLPKTRRKPRASGFQQKDYIKCYPALHKVSLGLEILLILPFNPEKLPEACRADGFLASL